jgi:sugar phosphate isomerase/epimerase
MELCIFTWFGFRYPFEEIIKLIKEAGFQSVMTWWGDEPDDSALPKERQPDIVRKAGLHLENTHFAFGEVNSLWEDTPNGQEIFRKYCSYVDDCKTHEIPTAVMHAATGKNPPPYGQLGLDRFKRLVEKAEKCGVNIALENVRNPEYMDYIFANIDSGRLKFCYDCGHENCFTPGVDFLAKYGDKLAALHLHDNDGTGDQHLLPFKGTVNWKRIMTQLKGLKFSGPLAFEIDAQFTDVSKEYTASEYLSEAVNRARKLTIY